MSKSGNDRSGARRAAIRMSSARLPDSPKWAPTGYPRAVRRQAHHRQRDGVSDRHLFRRSMRCVFAYYDARTFMPLIVINLLLVAVALLVPLRPPHQRHRRGALVIAVAEYAALFFFVAALRSQLRHSDQLHHRRRGRLRHLRPVPLSYRGRGDRRRIAAASGGAGSSTRRSAPDRRRADRSARANLYVSSAVTTFCIIALIVGYAFTVARPRPGRGRLRCSPTSCRRKASAGSDPDERVADSAGRRPRPVQRSVSACANVRAARRGATVAASRPDRHRVRPARGGASGVEKIKTTGDGYMAVRRRRARRKPTICRGSRAWRCRLPDLVERLSATHGVDLQDQGGHRRWAGDGRRDRRRQILPTTSGGETVNLASRLESHGLPGEIQVSDAVRDSAWRRFRVRGARGDRGEGRWTAGDLATEGGARRPRRARGSPAA